MTLLWYTHSGVGFDPDTALNEEQLAPTKNR